MWNCPGWTTLFQALQRSEKKRVVVMNGDLVHLCHLVERKNGGPPWKHMMDRSTHNMSYQAWQGNPEVLNVLLKSGVMLDTFTFNTMIFICGSHGYLSEAEELLNKMEGRGISPDTKTCNIFLSCGSKPKKFKEGQGGYASLKFGKVTLEQPIFWTGEKFSADGGREFLEMYPRHARL